MIEDDDLPFEVDWDIPKYMEGELDISLFYFDDVEGVDKNGRLLRNSLVRELMGLVRVVFHRLKHDIRVFTTSRKTCQASSDHGDFEMECGIKHLSNIVFAAFEENEYDPDKAMEFLEQLGIVPSLTTFDEDAY